MRSGELHPMKSQPKAEQAEAPRGRGRPKTSASVGVTTDQIRRAISETGVVPALKTNGELLSTIDTMEKAAQSVSIAQSIAECKHSAKHRVVLNHSDLSAGSEVIWCRWCGAIKTSTFGEWIRVK